VRVPVAFVFMQVRPINLKNRNLKGGLLSLGLLLVFGVTACATKSSPGAATISSEGVNGAASDQQRVQEIAAKREHDSFWTDFGIGPGDVLEISVADVPELTHRVERISPQGTIELPLAGSIQVGGLTEPQLHAVLTSAFSKYIEDPEVDVFVQSYSSRQVAVVGMVNKPGLYTLNRRNETISDLIGQAGGMSDNAGGSIIFVPALGNHNAISLNKEVASFQGPEKLRSDDSASAAVPTTAETRVQENAEQPDKKATANWQPSTNAIPGALVPGTHSIVISVTGGNQSDLDVPVRPGDLIIVPARGQVLVKGWVPTPGAYQITPSMTALGAVTAAGGQLFTSSAAVLRAGPGGEKIKLPVNLSDVESGQASDIQVQSGDVVIVERSVVGAVPYGIYSLMSRFGTGVALPLY
jgi:polysaccharide export outer membrane protein